MFSEFSFQPRLYHENAFSKMVQFYHDDQNENRLNYSDLFRQLVKLQNETSHRRTILLADLNKKESIN